jgi:hypothetical protein
MKIQLVYVGRMDSTLRRNWKPLIGTLMDGIERLMQEAEQNPQLAELRPDVLAAQITLTFRGVPTTLTVSPGLKFVYPDDPPIAATPEPTAPPAEPAPAKPEPATPVDPPPQTT